MSNAESVLWMIVVCALVAVAISKFIAWVESITSDDDDDDDDDWPDQAPITLFGAALFAS